MTRFFRKSSIVKMVPIAMGILLLAAGLSKLFVPKDVLPSLEPLHLDGFYLYFLVALIIISEIYVGGLLVLAKSKALAVKNCIGLLTIFTIYLAYIATLANPPNCNCLLLHKLFDNERYNAWIGICRNAALIATLCWYRSSNKSTMGSTQPA